MIIIVSHTNEEESSPYVIFVTYLYQDTTSVTSLFCVRFGAIDKGKLFDLETIRWAGLE
jgi:hypothetical protein